MSAIQQMQKNAQWVIDNFGPQSGLAQFGYDASSVAYLDTFIDRQGATFLATPQSTDRAVSLLGSFLGEAIIKTYGGAWSEGQNGIALSIKSKGQVHILQPFHKVYKRLTTGPAENLHTYFAVLLPQVIAR